MRIRRFHQAAAALRAPALALALLLPVVRPPAASAHGAMHEQIDLVTKEIEKTPRDPALFLRRGELWRLHGDWDAANADFDRALLLDPRLEFADLMRGRLFLDANWLKSARACLDRFLTTHTNHAEACTLRGRVMEKSGDRLAAAADFSRAIQYTPDPTPDLFIERAQVLIAEGGEHLDTALAGLEQGLKRLGPLVTLHLYALDVEVKLKRFDAALIRLDGVMEKSPRKETWLARRGEVLVQAGRPEDARKAFRAALAALDTLPPTRRQVPAVVELEKRLKDQIANPGAVLASPPKAATTEPPKP
jgi:tetratricopeptide (TPR) repeat protein